MNNSKTSASYVNEESTPALKRVRLPELSSGETPLLKSSMSEMAFESPHANEETPTNGDLESNRATKRGDYLSWDDYFMAVAFLSAQRSKDPSTQVNNLDFEQ